MSLNPHVQEKLFTVEEICHYMPKVELHAHLNGSITDGILAQLNGKLISEDSSSKSPSKTRPSQLQNINVRSLAECWKSFAKIHEAIRTPESLYTATCKVIEDCARDQVIYMELRTTPKRIHDIKSKDEYVQAVVKAIKDLRVGLPQILVKLLISIDRKNGEDDARENVLLTRKWSEMFPDVIVGLDVSGDPRHGSFEWIVPALKYARQLGIPISCHLSEVVNVEESQKFLEFRPERVSHGQFLHPTNRGTEELWQLAKESKVPMEVCITSNLISGVSPSMKDHYVKFLHEDRMPFTISTDDSGVFNTTLSIEYRRLLQIIPLQVQELRKICVNSVLYSFAADSEKKALKSRITQWWEDNQPDFNKNE